MIVITPDCKAKGLPSIVNIPTGSGVRGSSPQISADAYKGGEEGGGDLDQPKYLHLLRMVFF